jgi:hypothetical protein
MISGITNQTLDRYIMATRKAAPKQQNKVMLDAVSEAHRKETDLLEEKIMRNNLMSNITFLKESDKEIFTQAIV